jgi:hypothetical protein
MSMARIFRLLSILVGLSLSAWSWTAFASDIVNVVVTNRSGTAQTNAVVTFGHYFKSGAVPNGQTLAARTSGGAAVELQVDKKATHADGSLRHAVLTARLPSLAANGSEILTLSDVVASVPTSTVSLASLLATTFDAQAILTVGGTDYTASARTLLQSTTSQVWLSGPLVSEWIVGGPVKTAANAAHAHLTAYFHVRAYGNPVTRVSVDTVIENNWTLVSGAADRTYDVTLSVGGSPVYTRTGLVHYRHARWHKRAWWGSDPQLYAQLDTVYLQDSRAVPKYETLTPTAGFLNSVRQSVVPMDNGDHTDYMDNTGAQDAIGPLPRWDATYLVSGGDWRAYNYMKANADGGAAYPVHFRDENTQVPVTIDSYPNASLADPVASDPVIPAGGSANPHDPGSFASHQPSIGYLAYLVTGDYYYLEELQFWSSYNLIWVSSAGRAGSGAYRSATGSNGATGLWYTGTIRGQAWAYRNLAHAAVLTPTGHALKSYFDSKLKNNLAYDRWQYADGNSPDANNFGAMYSGEKEGTNEYRGFYDNFMSWAIQHIVDLGYSEAIPFRNYKLKMPLGLMGLSSTEYCFQLAPQYNWILGPGNTTWYTTFKQVYDATVPGASANACGSQAMANYLSSTKGGSYVINEMIGGQDLVDYYFANTQIAVAALVNSGIAGGSTAWARTQLSGIHPDYRDVPTYAVIPYTDSGTTASVTLAANPASVAPGGSTTLSWSGANVTGCTASGNWSGAKAVSGSETITNLTADATFTLSCSGSAGSASRSITVSIGDPETVGDDPTDGSGGTGGGSGTRSAGGGGAFEILLVLAALARRGWRLAKSDVAAHRH